MGPMDEEMRTQRLVAAEQRAEALFDEVVRRELIAPGRREQEVSDDVRDLAAELMGTSRFWHKRVVRAGPNTLEPYRENPPDREIAADDVVFLDLGPIFAPPGSPEWEADLGRTYVLGDDPVKHRLRDDLGRVFAAGRDHFEAHPDITGEQLYAEVVRLAEEAGWAFGGPHSGHLVGEFPHELIDERPQPQLHHPRQRRADAHAGPLGARLPLDPRGPPRRPRAARSAGSSSSCSPCRARRPPA